MENADFLFAAYTIIWAVVFGYVIFLTRKQAGLRRRMESIESKLNKETE